MEAYLRTLEASIQAYLPGLLGGIVLIIIAWIIATIVKVVVVRLLTAAKVDQRFGKHITSTGTPPSLAKTVGQVVFWLVILAFLPQILSSFALVGILGPFQAMLADILAFLPRLFGAIVIFAVGWLIARIASRVVQGIASAAGVDRLAERVGIASALGSQGLSGLLGMFVYFFILIPVLISALNALGLDAISRPASAMLNAILLAIPNIIAAVLMLAIAYLIGRVVSGLISNLLAAAGFNSLLARLGLSRQPGATPTTPAVLPASAGTGTLSTGAGSAQSQRTVATVSQQTPAQIVGHLILVAIMLFTSVEALRLLGFVSLAEIVAAFLGLAGQVILGLIIFGLGIYLANLAHEVVMDSDNPNAELLATAARISILILAGAMALRQMGLANEIVNLAFGLLLGAIAVAVALAFGLGGRDTAAKVLERMRGQVENSQKSQ